MFPPNHVIKLKLRQAKELLSLMKEENYQISIWMMRVNSIIEFLLANIQATHLDIFSHCLLINQDHQTLIIHQLNSNKVQINHKIYNKTHLSIKKITNKNKVLIHTYKMKVKILANSHKYPILIKAKLASSLANHDNKSQYQIKMSFLHHPLITYPVIHLNNCNKAYQQMSYKDRMKLKDWTKTKSNNCLMAN